MNETTQAQFKTEGDPAFPVADTETDNSADSPTVEETNAEETPSDGGESNPDETPTDPSDEKTNFADHPRWKEREEDWKNRFNDQESRHTEELAKLRQLVEQNLGNKQDKPETSEVPSWFGGDEKQWAEFQKWNQELIEGAKSTIVQEQEQKTEAEKKAIEEATDYMKSEISAIESNKELNPDGIKVDQNKLLKFTLDNELVDTQGRWNYKAAWKLMQAGVKSAKQATIDEKKQVAGASTSENKAEKPKPNVVTSEDFSNPSNRPW